MSLLRKSVATMIALTAIALPCNAGYTIKSPITQVNVSGGLVYIFVNYDPAVDTPHPVCATYNRYVFDGRTPEGKLLYNSLYAAFLMKLPVQIYGTGTCETEFGSETVLSFLTLSQWWP